MVFDRIGAVYVSPGVPLPPSVIDELVVAFLTAAATWINYDPASRRDALAVASVLGSWPCPFP